MEGVENCAVCFYYITCARDFNYTVDIRKGL